MSFICSPPSACFAPQLIASTSSPSLFTLPPSFLLFALRTFSAFECSPFRSLCGLSRAAYSLTIESSKWPYPEKLSLIIPLASRDLKGNESRLEVTRVGGGRGAEEIFIQGADPRAVRYAGMKCFSWIVFFSCFFATYMCRRVSDQIERAAHLFIFPIQQISTLILHPLGEKLEDLFLSATAAHRIEFVLVEKTPTPLSQYVFSFRILHLFSYIHLIVVLLCTHLCLSLCISPL